MEPRAIHVRIRRLTVDGRAAGAEAVAQGRFGDVLARALAEPSPPLGGSPGSGGDGLAPRVAAAIRSHPAFAAATRPAGGRP